MVDIGKQCAIGWKRALPRLQLPGQHVKFLSVMSFYSLWQHYISMTSQPLANADRGVMRIVGITELMHLPRLSLLSLTHYAILYLPLSLPNLPQTLAPSSFFPPFVATPQTLSSPLFPFHLLLSAACSSFSHIRGPLPEPLFEILSHFPSLCRNTPSKRLRWGSGMFVPVSLLLFSCADMTGAHPETVPAGQSCDTVSLALKPLMLQTLLRHLWTFAAAGCFFAL